VAVAGITIPADDRRSPASWSNDTSSRSCSIWIGSLSARAASSVDDVETGLEADLDGTGSPGLTMGSVATDEVADDDDQRRDTDDAAGHRSDVFEPGRSVLADEPRLDPSERTLRRVLRMNPLHDLVDRARESIPCFLDVAYESVRCAVAGTCAARVARVLLLGTAGHTILLDRVDAATSTAYVDTVSGRGRR
jgi:hypothetical protein